MVTDGGSKNPGRDRQDRATADPDGGAAGCIGPDTRTLAQDWITVWQSELSALAADPEMREAWQATVSLWAGAMSSLLRAMPRQPVPPWHEQPARRARAADAPRPAPAAAAPDARDAEIERLARHVAELERRLGELERGGRPAVDPKRRPRRGG